MNRRRIADRTYRLLGIIEEAERKPSFAADAAWQATLGDLLLAIRPEEFRRLRARAAVRQTETKQQAAELAGCSRSAIYQHTREGRHAA